MRKLAFIFFTLTSLTLNAQTYIDQWGLADFYGWPILNDSTTKAGYASMGGETRFSMASLRGSFGQDVEISKEKAIIISGQIEFIGGSGGDDYTPIRYALTHKADEGELLYVNTDSAQWSVNGGHSGYLFTPRSGTGTMANGTGGSGTIWTIINGNWYSTWSNNGWPAAAINQAPRDAEIVAGVYDFAISVQAIDDTTNEIRWYMLEEDKKYWFGGIVRDTAMTTMFNGIEFGINGGEYTQFNVIAMSVDLGDPIPNPQPEPHYFYVENWGIIGNRFAGWITSPGTYVGNVCISGDSPNTDMIAIRGEFIEPFSPSEEIGITLFGKLELEGGGIEAANSLRFGVFNSEDPGKLITEPQDSMRWTGREDKHTGYLFIPPSGTNSSPLWGAAGETGKWGGVVNNVWFEPQADSNYALGSAVQYPSNAVAGEGTYHFEISITLPESGGREIRFKLIKEDETYAFAGFAIDENVLLDTDYFNCISFALDSGNTITALHLRDVEIGWGNSISLPEWVTSVKQKENEIPTTFSLSQNFPNPFNPVTKIKYSVPYSTFISLKVFNLLGQEVAKLFEGKKEVGTYTVFFDGSDLSSRVYYYRLETDEFIKTKKLFLLK
jgi:hypothetical protein